MKKPRKTAQQIAADARQPYAAKIQQMEAALSALISTIENTGGIFYDERGWACPNGDRDWTDIGEAYVLACNALGRAPLIQEEQA